LARKRQKPENCMNCGDKLTGKYCSVCGQKNTVLRVSTWYLITDFLDEFVTPSSKLYKTLLYLIFRPGLLTKEYNAGRRVKYIRPLRLYIMFSVVYFFTLSLVVPFAEVTLSEDSVIGDINKMRKNLADSLAAAIPDSAERAEVLRVLDKAGLLLPSSQESSADSITFNYRGADPDSCDRTLVVGDSPFLQRHVSATEDDSAAGGEPEHESIKLELGDDLDSLVEVMRKSSTDSTGSYVGSWIKSFLVTRYDRIKEMTGEDFISALTSGFERNLPKMMFFLLPVFAMILKIIYPLSKKFYIEHLIFSLHFHSFAFLLMMLFIVLQLEFEALFGFVVLGILVYLFLAMRRAYGQSRTVTLVKYSMLLFGYMVTLIIAFVSTIAATMLFL